MITFAEDVIEERDFTVERGGADAAGLKQIRAYVGGLQLHGGTAIFTAMQRLPAGRRRRAARPGRLQGDPWLPVGSGCSATPSWTSAAAVPDSGYPRPSPRRRTNTV
jgi:hypothetical protein